MFLQVSLLTCSTLLSLANGYSRKVMAMVVGIALIAMGCAVYALAELMMGPCCCNAPAL